MTTICARYKPLQPIICWLLRGIGLLFVYTSLTLPASVTLADTPLVAMIKGEYPSWNFVFKDIAITATILGVLAIITMIILKFFEYRRGSARVVVFLRKADKIFIRNALTFLFFIFRWTVYVGVSLVCWFTLIKWLALLVPAKLHWPVYNSQPVIVIFGIIGLCFVARSFDKWQEKFGKKICIEAYL